MGQIVQDLSLLDAQIHVDADPQEEEEEKAFPDFTFHTNSKRLYWLFGRRRLSSTTIYILHPPPPNPFNQVSFYTYILGFDLWTHLWWLKKNSIGSRFPTGLMISSIVLPV